MEEAAKIIEQATPEQLEEARKIAPGLKNMQDVLFNYVAGAYYQLLAWKIKQTGVNEMLDMIKPLDQPIVCDKVKFYDHERCADETAYITVQMCPVDHNLSLELNKVRKHFIASQDKLKQLDNSNSMLFNKIGFYYLRAIYPQYKDVIDAIVGHPAPTLCLRNDATHCIFLLDDADEFGLSLRVDLRSNQDFVNSVYDAVHYLDPKMF